MTGEVVNLRQARKRKARADEARQAEENRASHGRPKSEKSLSKATEMLRDRLLDAGRLAPSDKKPSD